MALSPKSFPVGLGQKTNSSILFKSFQKLIHLSVLGIMKSHREKNQTTVVTMLFRGLII